jgi:soluble lytic murein transglycosylase-like protein
MSRTIGIIMAALLLSVAGAHGDPLCFDEAGAMYAIHPNILRAIAKVESNFQTRAINWNRNGTYDFGVMQINSNWAYSLGIDRWNTLGDSCSNIKTGAMILAGCMKKYGYTWEAIGCYNSQTPDKRDRYARMVYRQLRNIEREEHERRETPAVSRNSSDGVDATGFLSNEAGHTTPSLQPQETSLAGQVSAADESGVALNASYLGTRGATGL